MSSLASLTFTFCQMDPRLNTDRKNFYLLLLLSFQLGFSFANWSFLEAGHGKGAADGIGGTLKWTADELVSHGTDIPDADVFYAMITPKTLMKLFRAKEDDIRKIDSIIPNGLQAVPHIMLLHQLISLKTQDPCPGLELFLILPRRLVFMLYTNKTHFPQRRFRSRSRG